LLPYPFFYFYRKRFNKPLTVGKIFLLKEFIVIFQQYNFAFIFPVTPEEAR